MPPSVDGVLCLSAGGFHRMAYGRLTGTEGAGGVVCVHGLTRNRHDFDEFGRALQALGRNVAVPDIVGRGESDWLGDPSAYGYPQYMTDLTALLARLGWEEVDWVGTSMGGLVGMMMAALPGTPVRRLVLNDVGPVLPAKAIAQILDYAGADPLFSSIEEAEDHCRRTYASFGTLSDARWRHFAETSVRAVEDGYRLAYDPGIVIPLRASASGEDVVLWDLWDRLACPVLLLRGENSELLPLEVAVEMTLRGPGAELVTIAGCGHAPSLTKPREIEVVLEWLRRT